MPRITSDDFDAVLLDLDGVITASAKVHAEAWKRAFDQFLKEYAGKGDTRPFDKQADYEDYVDGKSRYDGAQSFLESRQIDVPRGDPSDTAGQKTVCGIANQKNELFEEALRKEQVDVFEGTVHWIRSLRRKGLKIAVVSSSRHCKAILENAGIAALFDTQVDGNAVKESNLEGKPAPDMFLKAAEILGVNPERTMVVEDALAGVEAGRNGKFGLVIGVDRKHDADAMKEHGADVVVSDLRELQSR